MRSLAFNFIRGIIRVALLVIFVWVLLLAGTQQTRSASPSPDTGGNQVYLPAVIKQQEDGGATPTPSPEMDVWLIHLNTYRAMAGLPPVNENPEWGNGAYLHSRYMVKNDFIGHTENSGNPWYTAEGEQAAQTSNLAASHSSTADDTYAIDLWMQAPFHAVGILDPRLRQVGYGSFREEDGGLQMGATLDVIRGLDELPPTVSYPIAWPADGSTVTLTSHFSEYPDPLSSCPAYQTPTGVPILLQIGPGDQTPKVLSHSFSRGNESLVHCVFDETSYTNSDSSAQNLGRAILGARDTIVLIPQQPLIPGTQYTVSIKLESGTYTWSFLVSETANQAEITSANLVIP
jgi:hypothetical protein